MISARNKRGGVEVLTFGATLLAVIILFIYITSYSLLVFVQFGALQVLSVAMLFMAIFLILAVIFLFGNRKFFFASLYYVSIKTILTGFGIGLLLIFFSNAVNASFFPYFRTFPLLETELGLGWHQDTAFHVALIQSILNFGYPSTALHGHPFLPYHVLSHYADAFILLVTRLDPYESYGLLFQYKIFMFLSSALFTITMMAREHGYITYIVSSLLLLPCIIGTWHAIGSHGLWVPSIVLLLSAPFVFGVLFRHGNVTSPQLLALFFIVVFIALGKISSGLMYAALIGSFLLVKQTKNFKIYLFCIASFVFFYIYAFLVFIPGQGAENLIDISQLGLKDFYVYFTDPYIVRKGRKVSASMPAIWANVAVLGAILMGGLSRNSIAAFGSSLIAIFCLYLVTASGRGYSASDIWYFQYGLSSVLLLLTFASVLECKCALWRGGFFDSLHYIKRIIFSLLCIVGLAYLTRYAFLPSINIFNLSYISFQQAIDNAYLRPFKNINRKLAPDKKMSLFNTRSEKLAALQELDTSRPLKGLRDDIKQIMRQKNLRQRDTGLLLTREYFAGQMKALKGHQWAQGMLVYAVTGVQLVRGVTGVATGYGFNNKSSLHRPVSAANIELGSACHVEGVANVLFYPSPFVDEVRFDTEYLLERCADSSVSVQ